MQLLTKPRRTSKRRSRVCALWAEEEEERSNATKPCGLAAYLHDLHETHTRTAHFLPQFSEFSAALSWLSRVVRL